MDHAKYNDLTGVLWRSRYGGLTLFAILIGVMTGCNTSQTAEPDQPLPRPVSYMTLKKQNPSRLAQVTGAVDSWKQELVGFQVAGRTRYVNESGVNVKGRIVNDAGNVPEAGTLIAKLDNEHYRIRLAEARDRVAQLQAETQAIRTDIEKGIPSEVKAARATYERARKAYERQRRLGKKQYVSRAPSMLPAPSSDRRKLV